MKVKIPKYKAIELDLPEWVEWVFFGPRIYFFENKPSLNGAWVSGKEGMILHVRTNAKELYKVVDGELVKYEM